MDIKNFLDNMSEDMKSYFPNIEKDLEIIGTLKEFMVSKDNPFIQLKDLEQNFDELKKKGLSLEIASFIKYHLYQTIIKKNFDLFYLSKVLNNEDDKDGR